MPQSARGVISNVIVDFNVLVSVIAVKIAILVFLFRILKVMLMHLSMSSEIGLAACAAKSGLVLFLSCSLTRRLIFASVY